MQLSVYTMQENEAPEIVWRPIGRASGETGEEALEQFCRRRGRTEGSFRFRDLDSRELAWTYRTLVSGRTIEGRE
jgi:hypothetical protein